MQGKWYGVEVETGPNFLVVPPPSAEVLIDGGNIEFADIGIRTKNGLFFTGMPIITVNSGADFVNCDIGIQTYYYGVWFGIPTDQSRIEGTGFIDHRIGMDLKNIKSIDIIGSEFINNDTGIQGVNVSPFIDGLNIVNSNLSNCKRRIFLTFPSGQNQRTDIINNYFSDMTSNITTGIHIQSGAGNNSEAFTNVVGNTFQDGIKDLMVKELIITLCKIIHLLVNRIMLS